MPWPTANITTANVDSGTDQPRLARVQIRDTIDAVNNIRAEFGMVNIATPVTDQIIGYTGSTWTNQYPILSRYTEPVYAIGTTSGNVTVNWNNGNQQTITANGNVTISFTNTPAAGTLTIIYDTNGTNRTLTWPNTARFAGGVRTISTTNTTDVIVVTTVNSGTTYLVSLVKGFAA